MKRAGELYYLIPTYENLCLAFRKAVRGKQIRQDVIAFRKGFDVNIQKLQNQILQHEPDIGHYRFFEVFDPKRRSICAASFPERVLHHAIMNVCESILEKYAIFDSYACRKGKGNRKALAKAQFFCREYDWYLKFDIRKYFDTIDHAIMLEQLSRRIKDEKLLSLFKKLLKTYNTAPGKGMPIGNLISQHLANFYLGGFDHWIKEERRAPAYLRYMDDCILFGKDKAHLKNELELIRQFLGQKLKLDLKENIQLNQCSNGIPFVGFRVFPHTIRLLSRSRSRFIKRFIKNETKWHDGEWSMKKLIKHIEPLVEFTRAANSEDFRRMVIERFGVPS